MEDIASRLKQARGKRSAKEFAALMGCSMQTIYRYEWGERVPDESFLQDLAEKTGVSIDWIKGGHLDHIAPVETTLRKKFSPSAKQYYAELEARMEKTELKLENLEEERRDLAAENRRLYREKELLLREKEELLRENATLREELARREAVHLSQPSGQSEHEELPSLFDKQQITPSSSQTPSTHK